jgi:hypothetical protein
MTRALALVAEAPALTQEALRRAIVCGCALALICAGQALPL